MQLHRIECRVLGRLADDDDDSAATVRRAILRLLDTAPDAAAHLPDLAQAVVPTLDHSSHIVRNLSASVITRCLSSSDSLQQQHDLSLAGSLLRALQVLTLKTALG